MFLPVLVTDFLRRAIRQYGKKVGIVDGDKSFAYAQYGDRINRLSHGLLALGVKKGDVVAVLDYNSHRFMEACYGIPQVGAIFLPINTRISLGELSYILNDSGAKYLLINENLGDMLQPVRNDIKGVKEIIFMRDGTNSNDLRIRGVEYEELLRSSSPSTPSGIELSETDPCGMCYSSGTTGHPKGMLFTHRMVYFQALNILFKAHLTDSSAVLYTIHMSHAFGMTFPYSLTAVGGKHVIVRAFRMDTCCNLIQTQKITQFFLAPTMANMMINYEDIGKYDLSTLRWIGIGGSPLSEKVLNAIQAQVKGAEICETYGLTENCGSETTAYIKDHLRNLPEQQKLNKLLSAGFEDLLSEVRVVNEAGEDVKPDSKEVGEVVLRGNNIIDGYWNLPEETAKTIVNGWLHTGDMAVIDSDCYIHIVDRKKDLIKSGGENIASVEVENVIHSHPAVLEVAVVSAPHEKWGETPAACVVLKPGAHLAKDEIISYCRERLAHFKAPTIVEFFDSLPKFGPGKFSKRELRERFWVGHEKRIA